jgi:hypothetical protein
MPKFCIGCNETKSKSLFFKGKIVCKECDKDNTNVATSTIGDASVFDEDIGVLAKLDILYDAIPKIFAKLENISQEVRELHGKVDTLQRVCDKLDTQHISKKLDAQHISSKSDLQDISDKLDIFCEDIVSNNLIISTRLSLLEESSAKLVASNALRNLSAKLLLREDDDSGRCTPM